MDSYILPYCHSVYVIVPISDTHVDILRSLFFYFPFHSSHTFLKIVLMGEYCMYGMNPQLSSVDHSVCISGNGIMVGSSLLLLFFFFFLLLL
mmetsp:Transcript_37518/g.38001  ORF Transcript_37518/g.38001 Transcript_37518/m.38001 type:complete len:92 (-) Transcript_37518:8-283(-)